MSNPAPAVQAVTCRRCGCPVERISGALVVLGTGTTADGLSYCPPNPDTPRPGSHQVRKNS